MRYSCFLSTALLRAWFLRSTKLEELETTDHRDKAFLSSSLGLSDSAGDHGLNSDIWASLECYDVDEDGQEELSLIIQTAAVQKMLTYSKMSHYKRRGGMEKALNLTLVYNIKEFRLIFVVYVGENSIEKGGFGVGLVALPT